MKEIRSLCLAGIGVIAGTLCVIYYDNHIMQSLPFIPRLALTILIYWLIALVPAFLDFRERREVIGEKEKNTGVALQIITGIALALLLSLLLTLIPNLAGYGDYVENGKLFSHPWQYVYDFICCILSVAAVEEYVFRGFFYERIRMLAGGEGTAVLASSVLFGLFHSFGGDLMQVLFTFLLGGIFCLMRLKIKSCTLLSLIVAHGVYDAMITVWTNFFA